MIAYVSDVLFNKQRISPCNSDDLGDDFGPESDVDVLLSFEEGETWSLLDLVAMKLDLEAVFGRTVDVMTRAAVEKSPNWVRRASILSTAQPVYAPS